MNAIHKWLKSSRVLLVCFALQTLIASSNAFVNTQHHDHRLRFGRERRPVFNVDVFAKNICILHGKLPLMLAATTGKQSSSEPTDQLKNTTVAPEDTQVAAAVSNNSEKLDLNQMKKLDIPDIEAMLEKISTTSDETSDNATARVRKEPLPLRVVLDDMKVLSSQVSYFYLRDEIGLSEDAMWKVTTEASSALGMTASTIRAKIDVLRSTMDLSDDDIRSILERHPTILHLSAEKNISPKIFFLVRALDLSKADLRELVLGQPAILSYARSNLQQKLKFFTTDLLGFSVEQCRQLVLSEPKLLTASVKGGLLPRARFFLRELEIPRDKLQTILKKNPRILLYSLEQNLIPKLINFCIMMLYMEPSTHVVKLLTTYPQFLDYNLERHILPITRYFLTELQFSSPEMRQILLKSPRLITFSLARIKYVAGYLRYELGFNADGVRRVLYQTPQVMGLDMEKNLAPKIAFLQEAFGFTDSQQVRQLILGMPAVLNLSVENNLAPKIDYLSHMIRISDGSNQSEEEQQRILRETILKMPALLGYSLDKRIQPRLQKIVNAGLPASSISVGIPMKEENFQKWLHGRQVKKAQRAIVLSQLSRPPTTQEKPERNGRIIHWTRQRKPSG